MSAILQVISGRDAGERARAFTRPALPPAGLEAQVAEMMQMVKTHGDAALMSYNQQFGAPAALPIAVTQAEIQAAGGLISEALKQAINQAAANIEAFHQGQFAGKQPQVQPMEGLACWRKQIGIEKVGLYIPGGTAPLFSTVLMLGIPSKIAGVRERIMCSPPDAQGQIHPAILYAASRCGITQIYKTGGAQAIAAMVHGTQTITAVSKIFGPGNQYVTEAKQQAARMGVAIDMPAGPSELLVIADAEAEPAFVAADVLSQCEHGADSQCIVIAIEGFDTELFQEALSAQLQALPRKSLATTALAHSRLVQASTAEEAIEWSNEYAPEHLIISTHNAEQLAEQVINAGSVFIGNYSPESAGDYASGTNHTLPTNGFAKAYSGVSVDSFCRQVTFQQLSKNGLKNLQHTVETMAMAEGLDAHARAVSIRFTQS